MFPATSILHHRSSNLERSWAPFSDFLQFHQIPEQGLLRLPLLQNYCFI